MQNVTEYETIIAIENADRKSLMKLFKAYDLNTLLMFDMSITQFVSKVSPYPHSNYNHKRRKVTDIYRGEVSDSDDEFIRQ